MTKFLIINQQKSKIFLYFVLCISLFIIFYACGEIIYSPSETEDTGSISFSVEWHGVPTTKNTTNFSATRALDCNTSGVATVEGEIYDENDTYLASGGPWNCSAHGGSIENVPEGSNRKAVILGKDSSGAIVYQGEKTGISVTAGQATNAGVIQVASATPTNVSATAGDGQVTISWDSVALATSYKIYWATWSGVSKTSYEDTTNPGSSTNPDTTIFESVLSYNGHTYAATKNSMTWEETNTLSNQHGGYLVTINDEQENLFIQINYSSFISELWIGYNDKDNEDTWVWANGEISTYTNWDTSEPNDVDGEDCGVIYESGFWNDVSCFFPSYAIVEWESVPATSYTYTDLTNGTTYYYVVTAINIYGESGESNEVSAMPSGIDFKLPDTGQTQSYTNTFGEDSDYTINPPSYTDNGNGAVIDNVTGLMWQKENDHIYLNWDDAVSYCNNLALTGYTDWRLPSKKEFISIVNYGTSTPAIDTTYFPSIWPSPFWSSTTLASDSSYAWSVDLPFYGSVSSTGNKSNSNYLMCVRGQELSFGNFTDNANGTITDNKTVLMWQQDETGSMDWEGALTYCENLSLAGYSDWRLPNIKELESISDDSTHNPAIDTNFFPDANASYYWSSTTSANNSSRAWRVGFGSFGVDDGDSKYGSYYVRCVRGGQ